MSSVFGEIPARIRESGHEVELLCGRMRVLINERYRASKERFKDALIRLSPVRLSADVAAASRRLEILEQRRNAAIGEQTRSL
ncbi:hypothetical protein OFM04_35415, partial [Escherichia coli]|nr:hypothetical protein [Escherichia coli]